MFNSVSSRVSRNEVALPKIFIPKALVAFCPIAHLIYTDAHDSGAFSNVCHLVIPRHQKINKVVNRIAEAVMS